MNLLPYIDDEVLFYEVKQVLSVVQASVDSVEEDIHKNVIDPFSATVDAMRQDITITDWLEQEKVRQIQKSMQNELGTFHQRILGSIDGWRDLSKGGVLDLQNDTKKIIAEIKNKHNTTKGNHKREVYEDINSLLTTTHKGYTGYYVEIIRKARNPFDKPFTPPDNRTKTRKEINENIRKIDGRSFYHLATGIPDALDQLYAALPVVISKILNVNAEKVTNDPAYSDLFIRAYPETKI